MAGKKQAGIFKIEIVGARCAVRRAIFCAGIAGSQADTRSESGGVADLQLGRLQVVKCVELLQANPRHPSLATHEYDSIENSYDSRTKDFEAYGQNRTPGAYPVFWYYGPGTGTGEITLIAITPHPWVL
jgi:hypothetical protein